MAWATQARREPRRVLAGPHRARPWALSRAGPHPALAGGPTAGVYGHRAHPGWWAQVLGLLIRRIRLAVQVSVGSVACLCHRRPS